MDLRWLAGAVPAGWWAGWCATAAPPEYRRTSRGRRTRGAAWTGPGTPPPPPPHNTGPRDAPAALAAEVAASHRRCAQAVHIPDCPLPAGDDPSATPATAQTPRCPAARRRARARPPDSAARLGCPSTRLPRFSAAPPNSAPRAIASQSFMSAHGVYGGASAGACRCGLQEEQAGRGHCKRVAVATAPGGAAREHAAAPRPAPTRRRSCGGRQGSSAGFYRPQGGRLRRGARGRARLSVPSPPEDRLAPPAHRARCAAAAGAGARQPPESGVPDMLRLPPPRVAAGPDRRGTSLAWRSALVRPPGGPPQRAHPAWLRARRQRLRDDEQARRARAAVLRCGPVAAAPGLAGAGFA